MTILILSMSKHALHINYYVSNYTATFVTFPLPTLRLSVATAGLICGFTGVGLSRATSMTVSCLD